MSIVQGTDLQSAHSQDAQLQVDCDFPGGNIIVDSIEGTTIKVHQDLRDTEGDWFYWYFRLRGGAGSTVNVQFTGSHVIGVHGPGVSLDGGVTWTWLGAEHVQENSFTYSVPADAEEVRFSWAMPYVERNLTALLEQYRDHPNLEVSTLCTTEKGRKAEMLRVGCINAEPRSRVLLTARNHCCETSASYVLDGIIHAILSEHEYAQWLRDNVEFLVIPFMDKDGVEQGDQGKNRRPHDHNRDWEAGIYATVRAVRELVPAWSQGKLRFSIDMHCPWKYGKHNEDIYFVGNPNQVIWAEAQKFTALLEEVNSGALPYFTSNNLPFGQAWNTGTNYSSKTTGAPLCSCAQWAAKQPGIRAATSIEVPYANASGMAVDQASATAFGYDIAHAIRRYLAE